MRLFSSSTNPLHYPTTKNLSLPLFLHLSCLLSANFSQGVAAQGYTRTGGCLVSFQYSSSKPLSQTKKKKKKGIYLYTLVLLATWSNPYVQACKWRFVTITSPCPLFFFLLFFRIHPAVPISCPFYLSFLFSGPDTTNMHR